MPSARLAVTGAAAARSGAGEFACAERGDHRGPVDDGHLLSAAGAGVAGDEPAGEVVAVEAGRLAMRSPTAASGQ